MGDFQTSNRRKHSKLTEYTNCVLMMEDVLTSEILTMFNYRAVVFIENGHVDKYLKFQSINL